MKLNRSNVLNVLNMVLSKARQYRLSKVWNKHGNSEWKARGTLQYRLYEVWCLRHPLTLTVLLVKILCQYLESFFSSILTSYWYFSETYRVSAFSKSSEVWVHAFLLCNFKHLTPFQDKVELVHLCQEVHKVLGHLHVRFTGKMTSSVVPRQHLKLRVLSRGGTQT